VSAALLEIDALTVEFGTPAGPLRAVDGATLRLEPGRALGLVGESGSGKSALATSILRLHQHARLGGAIRWKGEDLLRSDEKSMRKLRGSQIAMVFQDPMSSLNPAHRVGRQIAEPLRLHKRLSGAAVDAEVHALMAKVGIPDPVERAKAYPHQLSGGLRQRVLIAMALACGPELLIADEPTTAVDATIQAQIVELLRRLQRETGIAVLLITHDLGLVGELCDDVAVMYAGRIVETGPVAAVLGAPLHPYTAGLLASAPALDGDRGARLREIPGVVPDLRALPPGCRFQTRCAAAQERCRSDEPQWTAVDAARGHRCHFPLDNKGPR